MLKLPSAGFDEVWRIPDFRRYFYSTVTSSAGSSVTRVALPLYVYHETNSALFVALVSLAQVLPSCILGLFAGVLVDRTGSKRALIIRAELLSALLLASALVGLIVRGNSDGVWIVLLGFLGVQCCAVLVETANFAAVPSLVQKHRVVAGQSLITSAMTTSSLVFPWVGALAYSQWGIAPILAVDVLTFICAAWLARRMSGTLDTSRTAKNNESMLLQVTEGIKYIWNSALIRLLTSVGLLNAVCGGAVTTLYIVLAKEEYRIESNSPEMAWFAAMSAIGSFVGSAVLPHFRSRFSPVAVCGWALVLGTGSMWGMTTAHHPILSAAVYGLWQAAYFIVIMNGITLRMEIVPAELLGRVGSSARLVAWGGAPFGAFLAAGLSGHISAAASIQAFSALNLVAVGVLVVFMRSSARQAV